MKNILTLIILIALALPTVSLAAPVSWDFSGGILQPLQSMLSSLVRIPFLTATSATTTNLTVTSRLNLFGTVGTALSDFCVAITGGAGLCDGTDATGGAGGSSISTSSIPVAGNLSYWTSPSTLSDVATGTLSENVLGLDLDNSTRGLVGGSASFTLTSGYGIPSTTRMGTWDAKGNGTVTSVDMSVPLGLTVSGNPVTTNGTLTVSLTSGYTIPSTTRATNWDTAFGWGNHALGGYDQVTTAGDALTRTLNDFDFDGGAVPAGALGGTWASPTVDDDGHNHTGTTLSGIDISGDTNLSGDTEVVLTGDALSLGTALTFTSATTTNLDVTGALTLFGGGAKTTANAVCIQLTGSSDLCDGVDGGGGGGGEASDWQLGGTGYLVPTTTVGISIEASSTIQNLSVVNATTTNATTTNLRVGNSLSFGGVSGTTWSTFCTSITGSADLCDGSDATGAGGGGASDWRLSGGGDAITPTTTKGIVINASSTIDGSLTVSSSSPSYLAPLFNIATSTVPSGGLFSVNSTTTLSYSNSSTSPQNGAHVLVGAEPRYLATSDWGANLGVNGIIDSSYIYMKCFGPMMITAPTADGLGNCGDAVYYEDTTGATAGVSTFNILANGYAVPTITLAEGTASGGAGMFLNSKAVNMRPDMMMPRIQGYVASVRGASTTQMFGFTEEDVTGAGFESLSQAAVFMASTSLTIGGNWNFRLQKGPDITTVDTGISSTTLAFMRIDMDSRNVYAYIGSTSTPQKLVYSGAHNFSYSAAGFAGGAFMSRGNLTGTINAAMHIYGIELWYRKPYMWLNY
jgi:hypothetical protein